MFNRFLQSAWIFFSVKISKFHCNHRVNINVNWGVYIYQNSSVQENDTCIFNRRTNQDAALQIRLCCPVCTYFYTKKVMKPVTRNWQTGDCSLASVFFTAAALCKAVCVAMVYRQWVCTAQRSGSGQHRKQNCVENVVQTWYRKQKNSALLFKPK